MKRTFLLLLSTLILTISNAQFTTLVEDNFADMSKFHDLTKTFIWGPNSTLTTGFQLQNMADKNSLSYDAISLTTLAAETKKYNIDTGLKEATAWDYEFDNPLSRANDTIMVEFDVLWKALTSGGNEHRFVVAICHDYPTGGPAQNVIDSINMEAPFGRPSYNFRILGREAAGTNNYANVFYGGGNDSLGEFERYNNQYWIPGFISGPGGVSPEAATEYPEGPVVKWRQEPISPLDQWHHFIMEITVENVKIYEHPTGQSASKRLVMDLFTPTMKDTNTMISELNSYYSTSISDMPTLYNYFDNFNAVRFFFNGPDTHIANVIIKTTENIINTPEIKALADEFQVYPVPASDILHVENIESKEYTLYNMLGKIVMSGKSENGSINISSLKAGIYLLKMDDKTAKISIK